MSPSLGVDAPEIMFIGFSPITSDFQVGGFNPFEKYWSNWESSPNSGENKKCLKPPAR